MGIGAIWLLVKGFLGGISPKVWLYIGIGVAILAETLYVHHLGAASQKAKDGKVIVALQADVTNALDANASNIATISALKDSLTSCESGRIADQAAQASAMAQREAAALTAQKAYQKAKADLAALQKGRCAQWSQLPACGVTP